MNNKIEMISNKIKEKKYILFPFFTIWVGLEYIGAGSFSYIIIHDVGDIHIPLYLSFAQNIFKYRMTYWDQYAVCGFDYLSATVTELFHLNSILFLINDGGNDFVEDNCYCNYFFFGIILLKRIIYLKKVIHESMLKILK